MSGIAIYEEDEQMRALLREWLSEAGYRVREAAPGGVQCGGTEDLVIASVYMPKHAGAQLLREVQAAHPGTPLIAISGQFRSGLSAAGTTAQMRCILNGRLHRRVYANTLLPYGSHNNRTY